MSSPGRYAAGTTVSADRSRAEIESQLVRFGAGGFAYGWEERAAMVGFRLHGRQVRFVIALPDPDDRAFRFTPSRRERRSDTAAVAAYQQEVRRRWRALALAIKAKLEVVASGIATFDEEFLAHVVLPDGRTVAEVLVPEVDARYGTALTPPRLLPELEAGVS